MRLGARPLGLEAGLCPAGRDKKELLGLCPKGQSPSPTNNPQPAEQSLKSKGLSPRRTPFSSLIPLKWHSHPAPVVITGWFCGLRHYLNLNQLLG